MKNNILIVEDDKNISKLIKEIVKRKGFSGVVAEDGEIAHKLFESMNFNLIITDLKMPKVDGITFIKMVRDKNSNIPIIVITGYGSEKNRALAKEYNVSYFLVKPCPIKEISNAIDNAMGIISIP